MFWSACFELLPVGDILVEQLDLMTQVPKVSAVVTTVFHDCSSADGLPYWSSVDIPAPEIKYENQRPFRRPRLYTSGDSKAVEATSYGLLSMLADDGITTTTDNIVLWLQTMRMSNGGFVSTMVFEFLNNARFKQIGKTQV